MLITLKLKVNCKFGVNCIGTQHSAHQLRPAVSLDARRIRIADEGERRESYREDGRKPRERAAKECEGRNKALAERGVSAGEERREGLGWGVGFGEPEARGGSVAPGTRPCGGVGVGRRCRILCYQRHRSRKMISTCL